MAGSGQWREGSIAKEIGIYFRAGKSNPKLTDSTLKRRLNPSKGGWRSGSRVVRDNVAWRGSTHPIYFSNLRPGTRINTGGHAKGAFRRNRERKNRRNRDFRADAAFRTKPETRASTGVSGRREKGQSNVWP